MAGRHDTTHSPDGLWQLDGSLASAIGGPTMINHQGSPRWGDLIPGLRGYICASTSSAIGLSLANSLAFQTLGDITVECLVVVTDNLSTDDTIICMGLDSGAAADNTQWALRVAAGTDALRWTQENGVGVGTPFSFSMTLTPGVIHHIAGVRQSNTVYGYVDGRAVGSSALTAPTGGANGVLSIQSYSNGNVVAPQLGIASVKIKLAALSAAQIAAEALLTIGSYYPTVVP